MPAFVWDSIRRTTPRLLMLVCVAGFAGQHVHAQFDTSADAPPSVDRLLDDPSPMPTVIAADVPPEARAAFERGQALARDENFAQAVGEFHRAVQIDPGFKQGHMELGQSLLKMEQPRLAAQAFSKALLSSDAADDTGGILLARGQALLEAGETAKALKDFDEAVQTSPTDAEYLYYQGKALAQTAGQEIADGLPEASFTMQRAIDAFDRALANRPGYADALADRGLARADLGETDEAIDDLTAAAKLRPDDALYQYRLGLMYLRRASSTSASDAESTAQHRDDLTAAVTGLTNALEWERPDTEDFNADDTRLTRAVARMELAVLEAPEKRRAAFEAALADCDAVIEEKPDSAAAHFHRGVALRMLDEMRDAIESWTETLRLSPENTEARLRRGIAWYYLDEYDLAASDFRAVGLLPGDPRPDFWLGVIHAQRDDHFEAIRSYSAALQQNRRYRLAYFNRAISYMHLGAWQRAIDDLNEIIQLNPRDAEAYYRRGLIQQQLGRSDEAERSFEKARRLGQ